jgi:DNA repair exonuclease SbcCD ATPase subunit
VLAAEAREKRRAAGEHHEAQATLIATLPAAWQATALEEDVLKGLAAERNRLAPAVKAAADLATAERELDRLGVLVGELEEQRDGIAEADRRCVEAAQRDVAGTRDALEDARSTEQRALLAWQRGRDTAREVKNLQRAIVADQGRESDWRLLESLLGREHLQARLVEDARLGITEAANRELECISNGTLQLELRQVKKEGSDELELLVTDTTSVAAPIEAMFLSGSQRFRVAVAVALGIGQHVGGASRGQRAVMIDEGFGSLDADGVEAMARHLQDLSGRLERVLVVTHQKEMQTHFATCFKVEKRGRMSSVQQLSRLGG